MYMFRSAHPQTEFEVCDTGVNAVWKLYTVGGNPGSAAEPARAGTWALPLISVVSFRLCLMFPHRQGADTTCMTVIVTM